MESYIVRVYRGASLYPDRELRTHSFKRARKRIERLIREGFQPKLIPAQR